MNTNEIKIIGVGIAGIQVLERILPNKIKNTGLVVCDIDINNLPKSLVESKIHLETNLTRAFSTKNQFNIEPNCLQSIELDIAMNAAIDSFDLINQLLTENVKMAILTADLGNTTGAAVTPVIAQIAKKNGLFVAAIVHTPLNLLGRTAKQIADFGLKKLRDDCDLVLVIDHNKLQQFYGNTSFKSFAKKSEEIVIRLAKMILPLTTTNIDVLDLRLILTKHQNDPNLYIGLGEASGEWRARQAIDEALKNTLHYREDIEGVNNVYLDIHFGTTEISSEEKKQITKSIIQNTEKNIAIEFSINQDTALENFISIMVVAF